MADFTGVVNPKRVVQRRMEEAGEDPPAVPAKKASGDMSQADFSWGRKRGPQEEAIRQKKLVDKLRQRDADFKSSGY